MGTPEGSPDIKGNALGGFEDTVDVEDIAVGTLDGTKCIACITAGAFVGTVDFLGVGRKELDDGESEDIIMGSFDGVESSGGIAWDVSDGTIVTNE